MQNCVCIALINRSISSWIIQLKSRTTLNGIIFCARCIAQWISLLIEIRVDISLHTKSRAEKSANTQWIRCFWVNENERTNEQTTRLVNAGRKKTKELWACFVRYWFIIILNFWTFSVDLIWLVGFPCRCTCCVHVCMFSWTFSSLLCVCDLR